MGGNAINVHILLLAVVLFVVKMVFGLGDNKLEGFAANNDTRWVTDNPMLVPRAVPAKNITAFDVTRWPEILEGAPGLPADLVRQAISGAPSGTTVMLLADPQDARASFAGRPQFLMPKGHFLALTSLTTGFGMECGYQWVGKTIGYTCRSSLLFVLSVLHGHRISLKAVRLVHVPSSLWNKLEKVLAGSGGIDGGGGGGGAGGVLDVIVTFAIPESPHMLLLIRQNINIMGFQRMSLDRLRLTMPDVQIEQVSLIRMVDSARARVLARERTTKLPTLQLVAVVLHGAVPASVEGFSNAAAEPPFRCFGDDKIFTRAACESPYDVSGMRKPFRTVWDQKCVKDSDCPFNIGGGQGGCDTKKGECEMPVGARRLSYRQFDTRPPFQPFCYNSDAWDLTGCARTLAPEWAFPKKDSGRHIDLRPTANEILTSAVDNKRASDA